ncbi:MAG TPA: hypothetical protein VGV93_03790, partial [Acidimicrobiales bacterium]|nr:hypothetical protein [Acidimicrobiales bacterium]
MLRGRSSDGALPPCGAVWTVVATGATADVPFLGPTTFTQMMNLLGELDDQELGDDEELAALVREIRAFATGPAPEARPALM